MNYLPYLKSVADEPAATYIERSIANLRNALYEHPEDELQLKQQILILSQIKGKEDEVIGLAFELIALDVDKIYALDCYLILGRMYAQKKETTKAIEYYRKVIADYPTEQEPILELAELYENQFDYDAAIAVYDYFDNECFEYMKESMYHYKGVCYYNKKEHEKALECFQTSLTLNADDEDGTLTENIGGCYFNMKNYTEAFSWFRKLLEKDPQSADAHYGLGLCYQHTDDGYRAMHHYFEAVKIKPDFTDAYNNIAAITINQEGDYKAGIEMLKKAIDSCTDKKSLTIVYLNLTHVYNKLREFTLADYYKAEYMKSLGFDVSFEEDEDDD
ncbi:MAG TPA: tetratricopeptide repeat protein [Bacteroidales bacterium]